MKKSDLREEYRSWLINYIFPDAKTKRLCHSKVLRRLFDTEYVWFVKKDDNRVYDGLNMRLKFSDERGGVWNEWLGSSPCNMLEMMVALAERCEEEIMSDDAFGDRTHEWFWAMMENSGLLYFDDDRYDEKKVDAILRKIVDRTYDSYGNGNIFTVKNPTNDLSKTEIWYQMCWWLTENFEF